MGNEMGSFFSRSTLTSSRKFLLLLAELPSLKVLWQEHQNQRPPTLLFRLLRCTVQSILGASLSRVPAPGDRHLHEARLAWRRAHQLLPGPIQGGWLAGLAGRQVAQHPE